MLKSWKKLLLSLVLIFGFTGGVYAVGTPVTSNPYIPHVFVAGYTGSGLVGTGDVLAPIWLTNDRNLFIYGQGNYGYADQDWANNPWSGSAALGYRQIVANAFVLGAFVFGDYTNTLTNHKILQVSPGIEALGRAWEFRANGYFPLGDKDWTTQGWADEFGNYDYIRFNGHNMYDAWFIYHEEVGPGADAEVGRTLFKVKNVLVRGLVNGYYFKMRHNNDLRGGGASIELEPNTYLKFTANGSYDNYAHTQVMLGVQVSLYDLFSSDSKVLNDQDLQRRLFEPVQRNFANIASGSDVRMAGGPGERSPNGGGSGDNGGSPEVITWYGHNAGNPERTNVWFFNGAGVTLSSGVGVAQAVADGTYEHPFTDPEFDQGNVNNIAAYTAANGYAQAYLYFNPGAYAAGAAGTPIQILSNLSLWGRMGTNKGFQMPATGTNRSLFIGGMQLDSSTSVNNIRLQNDAMGTFATGILMNGAANVGINDSEIGVDGPTGSYVTGVKMESSTNLTISGSNIYGYNAPTPKASGPNPDDAVGLEVVNGGNVTATNGSLIQGHSVDGWGIGLYVAPTTDGSGNVESKIGNISGDKTATFSGTSDNNAGYGLYAYSYSDSDTATTSIGPISGSTFTGNASGGDGYGLYADSYSWDAGATTTIVSISGSTFTGDASGGGGVGYGLYANSYSDDYDATTSIGNISGSTFTGTSTAGWGGYGLYADTEGWGAGATTTTIGNISGSTFTGDAPGGNGFGLYADSFSWDADATTTIGSISGSTFTGNAPGGSGFGLYANAFDQVGMVPANVVIGDITDSTFTGEGSNIGAGLYASTFNFNTSTLMPGNITIGNITNSHFTGNSWGYGFGLYANSYSNDPSIPAIQIGNITDNSTFEGTGDFVGAGLYASTENGFMGPLNPGNITIGNITGSTFVGNATWGFGYGLYAATDDTVDIANTGGGQISGNTFTGIGGGPPPFSGDLWLWGSVVNVMGTDYASPANPDGLLAALGTGQFSSGTGYRVCVNGSCDTTP